ncbi:hypothetical protein ElyMa_004887900 [Elysia marginata]|uniref:Uncharacterized protein n=1 Tax=Elysia marginata TaxID=1093978 RepID=A0AAV4IT99_9GAST|nr:hypothetical protein ElyMa_004887900 [Elysia marginata]
MKSLLTMCGNGYKTLTEVSSERVSIPWHFSVNYERALVVVLSLKVVVVKVVVIVVVVVVVVVVVALVG